MKREKRTKERGRQRRANATRQRGTNENTNG